MRDVVVPETITVQELANRMAERGADVIKALMRMGVMATINQVDRRRHRRAGRHRVRPPAAPRRRSRRRDRPARRGRRRRRRWSRAPPVVTVMGHVDHGKTSLLDALRQTDVAAGEAGGITQHIGAYQVTLKGGQQITFIDTPGHQAFTAMRARGANVTDIVVLVVAADDGIMEQTVEAIRHAKAAERADHRRDQQDRPARRQARAGAPGTAAARDRGRGARRRRARRRGLGDSRRPISTSSRKRSCCRPKCSTSRPIPNRPAEGVVIEAKLERGRGPVATVLVQRGTLKVGDIFVAGSEWGRVRALVDDRGQNVNARPARRRRSRCWASTARRWRATISSSSRTRAAPARSPITASAAGATQQAAAGARGTLEQMFSQIAAGAAKELPVVVKSDVQGSLEAIIGSLEKLVDRRGRGARAARRRSAASTRAT